MVVTPGSAVKTGAEEAQHGEAIRADAGDATLEWLLLYAQFGWPVLPLHHIAADGVCSCGGKNCNGQPGKHPRWHARDLTNGLKSASADLRQVKIWHRRWPDANWGVACAGVVVVGPDGQGGLDDLAALEETLGPLPQTVTQFSGRRPGRHLLFRPPADGLGFPNKANVHGRRIDLRGCDTDGAALGYFVAAPSRNEGGPYEWAPGLGPGEVEVAELPPAWLNWFRDGPGKAEPGKRDTVMDSSPAPAANGRLVLTMKEGGRPSDEERCRLVLEKVKPAIQGQNGSARLFYAARCCVNGFGLSDEASLRLLRDVYNPRCVPPWSDKELAHKVDDCRKKPFDKADGWLRDAGDPAEEAASAGGEGRQGPAAGAPLPEVEIFTAPGLMNEVLPPPKYIVPALLTEGLAVMAGAPKQGKSRLMTIIALQVAAGGKALGFVDVEPGPVLYLALEDNKRRQQDRLAEILKGKPPPANYHGSIRWPRHHQQGRELIERWLDQHPDARMVVIDTWAKYKRPGRPVGNAYEDDYQMAGEVQRLALDRRICLGVVHHTKKGEAGDWVESISGTFGLAAAADCLLLFQRKRGEPDGVLQVTGRDVEESELALAWREEAGQWVIDGAAEVARASKSERVIIEALRKNGSPMTPSEVAIATGQNVQTVKSSLYRMSKKDMLSVERGKYSLRSVCV